MVSSLHNDSIHLWNICWAQCASEMFVVDVEILLSCDVDIIFLLCISVAYFVFTFKIGCMSTCHSTFSYQCICNTFSQSSHSDLYRLYSYLYHFTASPFDMWVLSLKVPEGWLWQCGSYACAFVYLLFFAWQHLTLRHAHPLNIYITDITDWRIPHL